MYESTAATAGQTAKISAATAGQTAKISAATAGQTDKSQATVTGRSAGTVWSRAKQVRMCLIASAVSKLITIHIFHHLQLLISYGWLPKVLHTEYVSINCCFGP